MRVVTGPVSARRMICPLRPARREEHDPARAHVAPMPIDSARRGTRRTSPSNNHAFARRALDGASRGAFAARASPPAVEAQVPVAADPQQHQVEAAHGREAALVAQRFAAHAARPAVQKFDPLGREVDLVEQMAPHEGVVAVRVARAQTRDSSRLTSSRG